MRTARRRSIRRGGSDDRRPIPTLVGFALELWLPGKILFRELDQFCPTLGDEDACVSRRQVEQVPDVYLGYVHSVQTLSELTNHTNANSFAEFLHAVDPIVMADASRRYTGSRWGATIV
jgi:hypothetical protein